MTSSNRGGWGPPGMAGRRSFLTTAAAASASVIATAGSPAMAQQQRSSGATWPGRTLRFLVPFAPGGPVEVPARFIAEHLSPRLGVPVIVETRPGAGGAIGAQAVARAADPHLLLFTTGSVAILPALMRDGTAGFDPIADFAPISLVTESYVALLVRPDSPIADLAALLARARAEPGRVSYGSSGIGSSTHLATALFARRAGVELLHVPYRGSGQALSALYAGDIDVLATGTIETLAHLREGRVRCLGVSAPQRLAAYPEVPAIAEAVPGYAMPVWIALLGPRAMPAEAVARLVAEMAPLRERGSALAERMAASGGELRLDGPVPLAARLREEVPQWQALATAAGIRAE